MSRVSQLARSISLHVPANTAVEIQYCGICGSDLHTMSNGWGSTKGNYPQVVGHEIVGKIVRVGKDVKHLKEGDVAGVGAQCDSCLECVNCKNGESNIAVQRAWG